MVINLSIMKKENQMIVWLKKIKTTTNKETN
jgi:hypothetical protein